MIVVHIGVASMSKGRRRLARLARLALVDETEDRRHEEKRRDRRADQAADHGAAERRVQFGAERHRRHADDHRERGHQDRPEAGEAGVDRGRRGVDALGQALAREADDQNAVGGGDAHAHDRARQGRNRQRRPRDEQHPDNAGERGRQGAHDDERIEPRLEIDDDQQVDQHDGERDADEELLIGVGHGLRSARA